MVLTAAKIDAGSDPEALDAEFVLIEAFIPTGLADLQQHIDDTRSILIPELYALGAFREYVCGDANGDGIVSVVDIVYLVNHLYAGGPAPDPYQAADANGDTRMDIADVVAIVNYLFLGYPIYCYGDRPCSDLGERDTLIIQGIWGSAGDTVDIPIFVFNDDSIFFNLSLVIPDPNKATFLDTVITEFTRLADIDVVQTLHDTTGIQIWFPDVGNEEYWNSIPPGSGIAAYLRCVLKEDIPLNSPMCIDTTFFPPGHSTGFYTPNTDCIIPEFECSTPTLFAPWDLEAWSDTLRTYLSWTNPQSYDSIRIYRGIDTLVLLDVLPGDDTSYSYTPDIGVYCYCLTVERDGIESNTSWPGCASYSPRPYEVPSVLSWSGSALAPPDTGEAQPEYFWRVKEESTLAKSPGWTYGPPTLEGGPAQCRTGLRPWVDDGWGTNRTEPYYEDDYCTNPLVSPAIRLPLWFPFGGVWLIVDHCYVTGDINDDDRLFVKIQDCDIPANQQYLTPVRGCEYAPGQGWNACDPVDGTPGFNGLPREWPNTSRCPSMYQIPEGPFNDRWVYIENYLGSDAVDDGPTPNGWFICRVRVIGTDVHRGDCNGDGMINIGDVIVLINYLFMNGDPPIPLPDGDSTGDANDDGDVNIADAVYLINFLFTGGSPPPPP
jgi:hypothetical protein